MAAQRSGTRLSDKPEVWNTYEHLIKNLYQGKNGRERHSLTEVRNILMKDYGFPDLPLSIYEKRLRNYLNLRKKMASNDWYLVWPHCRDILESGRAPVVVFNDTVIPWVKVWKEIRRRGAHTREIQPPCAALPPSIVIKSAEGAPKHFESTRALKRIAEKEIDHPPLLQKAASTGLISFLQPSEHLSGSTVPTNPQTQTTSRGYISTVLNIAREWDVQPVRPGLSEQNIPAGLGDVGSVFSPWLRAVVFSLSCQWDENYSLMERAHATQMHSLLVPLQLSIVRFYGFEYLDMASTQLSPLNGDKQAKVAFPWDFDVFYSLAEATFRFSNNLVHYVTPLKEDLALHQFIFNKIPEHLLLAYFRGSLPSIKAALLAFLQFSIFRGDMQSVFFLMKTEAVSLARLQRHAIVALVHAGHHHNLSSFLERVDVTRYALRTVALSLGKAIAWNHHTCYYPLLRWLRWAKNHEYGIPVDDVLREHLCFSPNSHDWHPKLVIAFRSSQLHHGTSATPIRDFEVPISYRSKEACSVAYEGLGKLGQFFLRAIHRDSRTGHWWPKDWHHTKLLSQSGLIIRVLDLNDVDWRFFAEFVSVRKASLGDDSCQPYIYLGAIVVSAIAQLPNTHVYDDDDLECTILNIAVRFLALEPSQSLMQCLREIVEVGARFTSEAIALAAAIDGVELLTLLKQLHADIAAEGALAIAVAARKHDPPLMHWLLQEKVPMHAPVETIARQLVGSELFNYRRPTITFIAGCVSRLIHPSQARAFMDGEFPQSIASLDTLRYLLYHGSWPRRDIDDHGPYGLMEDLFLASSEGCNSVLLKIISVLNKAILKRLGVSIGPHEGGKVTRITWADPRRMKDRSIPIQSPGFLPTAIFCGAPASNIETIIEKIGHIEVTGTWEHEIRAAVMSFHLHALGVLVKYGANLCARDRHGRTLLHMACSAHAANLEDAEKRLNIMQYLIEQGVDGEGEDPVGNTALTIAAERGDVRVASALLKHGIDQSCHKALVAAARHGRLDMVYLLLHEKSADLRGRLSVLDEAIRLAWQGKFYEVARRLQEFAGLTEDESDVESDEGSNDMIDVEKD